MGATVSTLAHVLHGIKAKGMILIEPIFLHEDFYRVRISVREHPLASKAMKRKNHWKSPSEAMGYLRSKTLFAHWTEEMRELYITHGMRERRGGGLELVCSPHTEAALFLGGVHYNIWPLLPKVSCPVLVIEGETTDSKNYIDLERAVALIPESISHNRRRCRTPYSHGATGSNHVTHQRFHSEHITKINRIASDHLLKNIHTRNIFSIKNKK